MAKGDATRERILDDAMKRASVIGLEALSIGELASSLGLSKSGLFAHFGSKEQLQLAVLRASVERFIDTVVRPALKQPRGEPRLRALAERWLDWGRASELPGGCILVAASSELDDRPGPLRDEIARAQKDWLGTLARAVEIAVAEGHFRSDVDPVQIAFETYGTMLAFHHAHRLLHDRSAARRARQSIDRIFEASH